MGKREKKTTVKAFSLQHETYLKLLEICDDLQARQSLVLKVLIENADLLTEKLESVKGTEYRYKK